MSEAEAKIVSAYLQFLLSPRRQDSGSEGGGGDGSPGGWSGVEAAEGNGSGGARLRNGG